MAEATTIAEFMARLGYTVDEESQRRFLDAIGTMTKSVLGLSAGLLAAAGGVVSAVTTILGSSEHFYYLSQRIGDSVKDVDALAFAFSKLGLSPQEAVAKIRAMADALHNNPYVRSVWRSITGSDEINSESLQKFGDYYHRQSTEMQRYIRTQLLPQSSQDFYLALNRGGPGGGVGEFNAMSVLFPGFKPDDIAKQSVAYENALRDVALRFTAIGGEIQGAMLPALTQSAQDLQKWLDDHAPQINHLIDLIKDKLGELPEPVRVAVGAIASILPALGHMDAGSAALALVLFQPLLSKLASLPGSILGNLPAINAAVLAIRTAMKAMDPETYAPEHLAPDSPFWRGMDPKDRAKAATTDHVPLLGDLGFDEARRKKEAIGKWLTDRLRGLSNLLGEPEQPGQPLGTSGLRITPGSQGAPVVPSGAPGSAAVPAGAPGSPVAAPGEDGQSLVSKMWHGFWESIVGTAHAEELPPKIKMLSQHVMDLNDTLSDLVDQIVVNQGMKDAGDNIGDAFGLQGGGSSGKSIPSKSVNSPEAAAAIKHLMALGWPLPAAIGMVANLLNESGLNPNPPETSFNAGHAGIAQWDKQRQQDFFLKMGKRVQDASVDEQLDFLDYENRHKEAATGQKLMQTFDPQAAAAIFNTGSERSGVNSAHRMANAHALERNPYLYTTNNNAGHSVNQTNTVTINAPSGDAAAIAGAWKGESERNWADVNRNLRTPLY